MRLTIENLSFEYSANKKVLDDVSFTAQSGRNLFILGPNGAGKSTLVSNILRFLKPKTGKISIDGRDLGAMKPNARAKLIGYVPQNVNFPSMTAFDAVLLGRRPYIKWDASKEDLNIVQRIFEDLELSEFALRDVNKLSGGEQQKIAIARVLAQRTPVMLFDELTSNLDIKNQIAVLTFLKKLTNENTVTISIVHDLNLALRFADDILLLKQGKVMKFGPAESLNAEDIKNTFDVEARISEIDNGKIIIYGDRI